MHCQCMILFNFFHCYILNSSGPYKALQSKSKRNYNLAMTQLLKGLQFYTSFQQLESVSSFFPGDLEKSHKHS